MKRVGRFLIGLLLMTASGYGADLTLFGGVQHSGKITFQDSLSAVITQVRNPGNAGVFGLRIGQGGVWGSEHTLAYSAHFLDGNAKAVIYNSNVRIQVPTPVVKPYVTAGLGGIFTTQTDTVLTGSKFAANYGGGVKVQFAGPFGASIDVRGYTIPGVQSQTVNLTEVSLGVFVAF
jgi:hypothetical protein